MSDAEWPRRRTPLVIPQGTKRGWAWPVFDDDNAPLDISGWMLWSQIRPEADSSVVLHEWSTELGNATTTSDGFATILLEKEDSLGWEWRSGAYDVLLISPDESVYDRIAEGPVIVSPGVTR